MKKAIVIIASERDLYFKQCVDALLLNNLDGWDIIVSLDGVKNYEYFKTLIDAKFIVNEQPLGVGKHIINLRRKLFTEYDYVLQVEDDVVVAPTFVDLNWAFMQWSESTYDNIGTVSGSNYTFGSPEDKIKNIGLFCSSPYGSPAVLMSRKTWKIIEPIMFEYLLLIPNEYHLRDGVKIGAWMQKKCSMIKPVLTTNSYPLGVTEDHFIHTNCFSQDKAHALAIFLSGLASLVTHIPYCKNIGEWGVHSNPDSYKNSALPLVELNYFEIPTKFISL